MLSNLRFRDEIFQEGNFTSLKKDGLHVYKRFVDNPLEKVCFQALESGFQKKPLDLPVGAELARDR